MRPIINVNGGKFNWVAAAITAVLLIVGLYYYSPTKGDEDPSVVSTALIQAMVSCISNDTCQTRRQPLSVGNKNFWTVQVVIKGYTIDYLVGGDKTFRVMTTSSEKKEKEVRLFEDIGYTGRLQRVLDISGGSLVTISASDPGTEGIFQSAQGLYLVVMRLAGERVLPHKGSTSIM